jgi:hypothetical protein
MELAHAPAELLAQVILAQELTEFHGLDVFTLSIRSGRLSAAPAGGGEDYASVGSARRA